MSYDHMIHFNKMFLYLFSVLQVIRVDIIQFTSLLSSTPDIRLICNDRETSTSFPASENKNINNTMQTQLKETFF